MENSSSAGLVPKAKWEDLNTDLLHSIFQRVALDVLLCDLPLICKSWYQASMDPQICQTLDFSNVSAISYDLDFDSDDERKVPRKIIVHSDDPWGSLMNSPTQCVLISNLVQLAIKRSQGIATDVILPVLYDNKIINDTIRFISQGCPAMRSLTLQGAFSSFSTSFLEKVLPEIQAHCKNFEGLNAGGGFLSTSDATAIVTYVPDIKYLTICNSVIRSENLVLILSKCRKLELLDVRSCVGFAADDVEILEMTSHIKTFISRRPVSSYTSSEDNLCGINFEDDEYYEQTEGEIEDDGYYEDSDVDYEY
ncbi:hypothetical protein ACHQM5_022752 [Ranunculus cassubicifolius]